MYTDTIAEFTTWNELASIHQGPGICLNPSCQEKIVLNWASEQMWRKKAQNSVLLCLPLLMNTLWLCQWVQQQPNPSFSEPNIFPFLSEIPSFQFFSLILVCSYSTQSCYPRIRSNARATWLWSVDEHMCWARVTDGTLKTSALGNWLNCFFSPPSYFQSQIPNAFSNSGNRIPGVDVVFISPSGSSHLRFITVHHNSPVSRETGHVTYGRSSLWCIVVSFLLLSCLPVTYGLDVCHKHIVISVCGCLGAH